MCISIHVALYFKIILQLKKMPHVFWEMTLENYQTSYILTAEALMYYSYM